MTSARTAGRGRAARRRAARRASAAARAPRRPSAACARLVGALAGARASALVDRDLRIVALRGPRRSSAPAGAPRSSSAARSPTRSPPERAEELLAVRTSRARRPRPARSSGPSVRSDACSGSTCCRSREGGEITHAALTFRDIGAERALQRSLEEQRVFLSAVLAQLGERVRVADADGRLHAFDGSDDRRRSAPARVGRALRPAPPRRHAVRPARGAAAARAARRAGARRRGPRRDAEGRRALLESGGPVIGRRRRAASAPWSSTPT